MKKSTVCKKCPNYPCLKLEHNSLEHLRNLLQCPAIEHKPVVQAYQSVSALATALNKNTKEIQTN